MHGVRFTTTKTALRHHLPWDVMGDDFLHIKRWSYGFLFAPSLYPCAFLYSPRSATISDRWNRYMSLISSRALELQTVDLMWNSFALDCVIILVLSSFICRVAYRLKLISRGLSVTRVPQKRSTQKWYI